MMCKMCSPSAPTSAEKTLLSHHTLFSAFSFILTFFSFPSSNLSFYSHCGCVAGVISRDCSRRQTHRKRAGFLSSSLETSFNAKKRQRKKLNVRHKSHCMNCEMSILIVWVSCKPHFPGSTEGSKWNT